MIVPLNGALPLSHALQALETNDQLLGGIGLSVVTPPTLGLTTETLRLYVVMPWVCNMENLFKH